MDADRRPLDGEAAADAARAHDGTGAGPDRRAASRGAAAGGGASSLDETLLLLNRVMHAAVTSIVVTDPHLPDNPIVYHNPAFERVSGYGAHEIDGNNCRFLQGPETDRAVVAEIRAAIRAERACNVVLLNYRKDGTPFWNELAMSPVHDADGRLTHFVGVQNDVTRRTEAEHERDALLAQQQRIADTLQRALLLTPPAGELNGLDVSTQYEAAWDEALFGGDFFDTVALSEDRVALVVGDCTGKGLQAAQYTAEVKYALRVLLREYGSPTPALHRLNTFLMDAQRLDAREQNALVCVCVAVVDMHTGEASVAAAGMEPPLLVRADGRAEPVEARGIILGINADAEYPVETVTLGEGDTLLLLTDGITEARAPRPRRDFFGYAGLTETARVAARLPTLEAMGQRIVGAAKAFAGGRPGDDVCLLLARRVAVAPAAAGEAPAPSAPASAEAAEQDGDLARFALDVTSLGYWELDTATGAARRSARHDAIFGYDAPPTAWNYDQFLGHVHPDDRARVDALYGRALAAGTDWQFTCRITRAGDGAVRWIAVQGRHFRNESGGAAARRIIGTVADVTEDKEAEQAVREAAGRLQLVTDAAPFLISYVGADLRYRLVNREYAEWFGRPAEHFVGRTVPEVVGAAAFRKVREHVEAALSGRRVTYEALLPYAEGGPRFVHTDLIPDAAADGTVRGYVAVISDITGRKRAEDELRASAEALRASEAFLQLTLESAGLGSWQFDLASEVAVASERVRRLFGAREGEAPADYWFARLHPEDRDRVQAEFQAALAGERPYDAEYRVVRDGGVRWVRAHGRMLTGEDGTRRLLGVAEDITDRKRAEEERRVSEERYRLLMLATTRIVWWTDASGAIVKPTPLWGEVTGQTEEQYRGWGWLNAIHPEDRAHVAAMWHVALTGKELYECEYRLRVQDGSYRNMVARAAPLCDASGNVTEWFGANTDVTEERRAQAEREETLAQLEAVLESAMDGVIVSDTDGNVLMWNPAGLAMHEYRDIAEARRHLSEFPDTFTLYPGEEDSPLPLAAWPLARLLRDETFTEYEVRVRRTDTGKEWWAAYSGSIARDREGQPLLLVLTVRDVTERRRLEAQRAALTRQVAEAAEQQRRFLKEMLFGLTEGRLRLCDTEADLPAPLPPACDPVMLSAPLLHVLRRQVEGIAEPLRLPKERLYDLQTAVGEAAMNAVQHGGGGEGRIHADPATGAIQVWVRDRGDGIAEHLIHRAIERGWTTGGFGQGMWLMLRCADRVHLLTGAAGTTVVLEQDRTPPMPSWLHV